MNSPNNNKNNGSASNKPEGGPSIELKAEKPPAAGIGPQAASPEVKAPGKSDLHPLSTAMQEKWSKLSDADLNGVKSQQELAAIVETRYGIAADQAKTQVQAWAQGRAF